MRNAINEIKQIIKDEVPQVKVTTPRHIETLRGQWPCVTITKIADNEKKGIRTVNAAVDIYAVNEYDADTAAIAIDETLRCHGFWRTAARGRPEVLASALRLVYVWTEAARRCPVSLAYKSGGFVVTMQTEDAENHGTSVYALVSEDGLFQMYMKQTEKEDTLSDGGRVSPELAVPREITLTGIIKRNIPEARLLLDMAMSPLRMGELIVGDKRLVCQVTESPVFREDGAIWFRVKLLARQPYFEDISEAYAKLYGFQGGVQFPAQIEDGFEFGAKRLDGAFIVVNSGDVDVGMRLRILATGEAANPSVRNADTGERVKFLLTLQEGDELHVTTIENRKMAKLVRGGGETNAMPYLDPQSRFITLKSGLNLLVAEAEEGAPMLQAETFFRRKYVSAQEVGGRR